jgi:hypothetical protein
LQELQNFLSKSLKSKGKDESNAAKTSSIYNPLAYTSGKVDLLVNIIVYFFSKVQKYQLIKL